MRMDEGEAVPGANMDALAFSYYYYTTTTTTRRNE